MTNQEILQLLFLLKKYAEEELDQFDHIFFETKWGKTYVSIANSPCIHGYKDVTLMIPAGDPDVS